MCLQSFKSYSHKKECMYHPHLIYKLLESSGSIEITHSSLTPNLSHPPVFLTIIYWCRKLIWYLFNYLQLLNMQAQLFVRLSCHYSNFQSDGTKASKCVSIKVKRILPHVLPLTNKKFMSVFSLTTAHYLHHNLCLLSSQDLFSFVLYIYVHVPAYVEACACEHPCSQKPGDGGFSVAVITSNGEPLGGVLGTELHSAERAVHTHNHWATSLASKYMNSVTHNYNRMFMSKTNTTEIWKHH